MCGGFTCSKNSLLALNILYVVVSFILIGVAAAAKFASIVSSLTLVSGIITCGVFLLLISIVGLVGASKHHQVMLFFYMIVLFIIFIIQFSVACACLAMNTNQQRILADEGWNVISTDDMKADAQSLFGCCGYKNQTESHPSCMKVMDKNSNQSCCPGVSNDTLCCRGDACQCSTCDLPIQDAMQRGFNLVGGVGLFFSFTEFIGVWLTVRYRNQRDPRANPSAFL
ncbi:tetraspanin-13 isoform X2 [Palaemon carinicauda]|uniref:tetraspanin-13 isoform X2 n=1 Tax=Palaemon carinicauda TaxID=392227 RepID=UPI0035B5E84F